MRKYYLGIILSLLACTANAAVIHTYEFGNTANGRPDSGTLMFSSEGTPLIGSNFIESDYGELKATINGSYYDFANMDGPGGGWTQTSEQYLYDFISSNSQVLIVANLIKGSQTLQYSARFTWFDEPTGFGVGALLFREWLNGSKTEEYPAEVGYLHTTSPVPIPAAAWLFGSGLIGLIGLARRKT